MNKSQPNVVSPKDDMHFVSFTRPILDELSCSENLKEFHSLNTEEVEANLLLDCPKSEHTTSSTLQGHMRNTEVNIHEQPKEVRQDEKAEEADLGNMFFQHDNDIKLEFSCESEEIVEQNFTTEYFIDDLCKKQHAEDFLQIEVYSTPATQDICDEDNFVDGSSESIGILEAIIESKSNLQSECNNNNAKATSTALSREESNTVEARIDDNSELSNIMSDHNYTSQELAARAELPVETLRHNLINHILSKSCNGTNAAYLISPEVTEFVKEILERLNAFSLVPESTKREDIDDCDNSDRDTFLQNVMDTVVAEDAAEEEEEGNDSICMLGVTVKTEKVAADNKHKGNNDKEVNTSETCKVQKDSNITADNDDVIPHSLASIVEPKCTEAETHINSQSFTLSENCSEPMEHANFEDIFEHLTSDNDDKGDQHKPNERFTEVLAKLISFGKTLNEDCTSFLSASTNIEEKLQRYMVTQFNEFKTLTHMASLQEDKNLQTEQRISKRKLKKINSRNKKTLLESSDSSDDNTASSTETSTNSDVESPVTSTSPGKMCRVRIKLETAAELQETASSVWNRNTCISEYDDGVPLSQYIQSEIFESEIFSNESSMSPKCPYRAALKSDNATDSDSDNGSTLKTANIAKHSSTKIETKDISLNESDKENANSVPTLVLKPLDKLEDTDKEIERLINFNGLSKRSVYNGSAKSSETDKSKIKSQNQTKKQNLLDFMGDYLQKEAASDESISESEEEIITEKQYLARCNENLKQQLLNASSSDSEDMESNSVLDEVLSDDADDGEDNKSPKIEKFLKNFNIEESDNENEPELEVEAELEAGSDKDTSETLLPENNNSKYTLTNDELKNMDNKCTDLMDEAKKSNANSTDNSDCELLNDHLLLRKRSKPKSLEKMLSEADKRKRTSKIDEDLISLSSESDCSDVEAVDVEPADSNSRIIKPMLRQDQLASETRKAQKNETDRIRRLEKKQAMLAKTLKEHTEVQKSGELILDYNEETKTFIKVHPGIVKHLKKHQVDGLKFMYDSCYGGVEALKKNGGSGCILAHCMGLGKTLQLIALLHTVISYKELKTTKILVLCPKSTVMNWADEIVRWLGPLNTKNVKVYTFSDSSDINEKLSVMKEWSLSTQTKAGCLLVGYEAFRTLVFYHSYKNRGNVSTARLEDIRDKVVKYLLKPGADLVVCDEGHIIKNSKSAISLAVAQIITSKRIVLTGTPIQNNLKEYYSMVNFIKPLFLGTEKEFANLYANPIKNGQHKDSSKRDIKVMKQRSFVLHKKLSKFVQRKEAELLKSFLPQKFEYVLFIPMTNVQNNLYEHILAAISRREENRGRSLITDYTCLRKIWTHPKVLEDAWINATKQKNKKDARKNQMPHSDDDQPDDIYDSQTGVMSVTNDWWRHLLTSKDLESILPSNKLRTMFEILRMCEEKGEKCLIFSAFVAVLNVVEHFFKKITTGDPETLRHMNISAIKAKNAWISGHDYYRLDGKTPKSIRHEMIKRFNSIDNRRARVFLISAKAGGQGINLIGANRVIILDTSWNPSNDQQNIFRIFRLGQRRNCYIYRLLAMGTMEEKVYSRSVTKQAMSYRVVDEQQIDRHYSMAELAELYTLTIPNSAERPTPVFPQDYILVSLLRNFPDMVFKYHEHDSLLENKVEQELSEQEKADAWDAYERDLQLTSEIRGLSNMEDMQNNLAAAKMQNYFGALSGLDMQTLLNYSGLGQQAAPAPAPYAHSLLSQYNYPATNQQYLDMLNLYRKYAQSSMGYTEMGESAYTASAYGALSAAAQKQSIPGSAASMMTGLHGGPAASAANPLSALGDLSMYGMGAPKSLPTSSNTPPALPQHTSMHANVPTSSATPSALLQSVFHNYYNYANEYRVANSGVKSTFPNPNPAHVNPLNQFISAPPYQAPVNPPTNEASSRQDQLSYLKPTLPLPPTVTELPKKQTTTDNDKAGKNLAKENVMTSVIRRSESGSKVASNIDKSISLTTVDTQRSTKPVSMPSLVDTQRSTKPTPTPPLIDSQRSSRPNPPLPPPPKRSTPTPQAAKPNLLPAMTATKQKMITPITTTAPAATTNVTTAATMSDPQRSLNMGISYPKTNSSSSGALSPKSGAAAAAASLNMGIVYPNANAPPTTATNSTELLKRSNEMQIIPTNSPPGTGSISKQFNAISPSISLTAVRNVATANVKSLITTGGSKLPPSQKITTPTNNNSNNNSINGNQPIINNNSGRAHSNSGGSSSRASIGKPNKPSNASNATNANATLKNNSNFIHHNNNKHKIKSNTIKPSAASTPLSSVAPPLNTLTKAAPKSKVTTAFQSNYQNTATPTTPQQKVSTPAVTSTTTMKKHVMKTTPQSSLLQNHRRTGSPIAMTSIKTSTIPANISNATLQATSNVRQTLSSQKTVPNKSHMPLVHQIAASGSAATYLTPAQLQKRVSTATTTIPAVKNALNIRPVDNKRNSSGTGVYIIETNINEKRVAIGAPTKSGGGTTITKIGPKKRKTQDISFIEAKRTKF